MKLIKKSIKYGVAAAAITLGTISGVSAQAPDFSNEAKQFVSVNEERVLLMNVRIIDGTGAPVRENQSILIENGKITAITQVAASIAPEGTRVIDLKGKSVMPGIVGLHEHMFYNASDPENFIQSTQPIVTMPVKAIANIPISIISQNEIKIPMICSQG